MGLLSEHILHTRPFGLGGKNVTREVVCPRENGDQGDQIDLFSPGDPWRFLADC